MRKKSKNSSVTAWMAILLCTFMILSCSQPWDDFKKYTKDGEIIYIGKIESPTFYPGKERVRLLGLLTPDPKIAKCKIFWHDNRDSVTFDIDRSSSGNIIDKSFSVSEGVTSFMIYTYDNEGNSSVGVSAVGSSYGTRYRNSLYNRKIKTIDYDKGATTVFWDIIDAGLSPLEMEVRYKAVTGDTVVITKATETSSVLKGLKYETDGFTYRTVFRPVFNKLNSIDTFCTAYAARGIPTFAEKELDRSLFRAVTNLPGDVGPNGGSGGIAAMWDGKANGYGNSSFTDLNASLQTSPSMITFDLGLKAKLSKVWILPFRDPTWFSFTTMKRFEIWGSANPNPNGALDASWSKLGSYTVVRPSGRAEGQPDTPEDIALASAGFTWAADANAPKVRYLRIRCLESFRPGITAQSVGEIRVYGLLPQ
jgi:hypothetical protein